MLEITKESVREMLQTTEHFQKDCHSLVEAILDEKKVGYQDATNVWLFKKLAEFEVRLRQLENAVQQ